MSLMNAVSVVIAFAVGALVTVALIHCWKSRGDRVLLGGLPALPKNGASDRGMEEVGAR